MPADVVFALLRSYKAGPPGLRSVVDGVACHSSFPLSPTDHPQTCSNLYIDTKHILHACGNPARWGTPHLPEQEATEDLCLEIALYLDRLVHCLRPQQLLYIAVDGVTRAEGEAGQQAPQAAGLGGTSGGLGHAFMRCLTTHLRAFMPRKLASDPVWQQIPWIILSDSGVPGAGERKIVRFMERQNLPPPFRYPIKRRSFANCGSDLLLLGLLPKEVPPCMESQESLCMEGAGHPCSMEDEVVIIEAPREDKNIWGADACPSLAQLCPNGFSMEASRELVAGGLPWSPHLHRHFQPAFQRAVREMLLVNECRGFAAGLIGASALSTPQQAGCGGHGSTPGRAQQAQEAGASIRLPEEVMMLVLGLAARPLVAWGSKPCSSRPCNSFSGGRR